MIVLGIETSCDETSVSVVSSKKEILSNIVSSQIDIHAKYGGVVPEIAARAHLEEINQVFHLAIKKAGIMLNDIDAIAATCGPGLIGGLIVGSSFAKGLSISLKKPFIPINHLMGHALTPRLTNELEYPYILLLASGGHCIIAEIHGPKSAKVLGNTIDDSAGECFDKVAKMLELPYPGGPKIESLAKSGNPTAFNFPRPLLKANNCDFSFSGLKTAVLYQIQALGESFKDHTNDICASFQNAVSDIFLKKLSLAVKMAPKDIKSIAFAGGVSANQFINSNIRNLALKNGLDFFNSPINLCTDNGAMIAWCGVEQFSLDNLITYEPRSIWPLDEFV